MNAKLYVRAATVATTLSALVAVSGAGHKWF